MTTLPENRNPAWNGPIAAAILAAGAGAFSVGVLYVAGDVSKRINVFLSFYGPSGALSGVGCISTIVWLVLWIVLAARWARKDVSLRKISTVALLLLFGGILLTFPPIAELF